MEQLPHQPGTLSNQLINRNSEKTLATLNNPDSVLNLQVAGRDQSSGDLLLSYPGSNATVTATPTDVETSAYPGQPTQATRYTPQSGQRKVLAATPSQKGNSVVTDSSGAITKGATKPVEPTSDEDPCDDEDKDPDEPEENPQDDPTAPEDPEGPNPGNPGDSGNTGNEGCNDATDPCGWYTGSCPAGTTESQRTTAPDGSTKVLCCGPARPPGEGCDWKTPAVKFKCVNGNCIQATDGTFDTLDECLNSGCQDDSPEPTPDPSDPGNTGPDGENGSPSDSADGSGGSGEATMDGGVGDPPFTGGQCCDTGWQVFYTYSLVNQDNGSTRGPFSSNVFTNIGTLSSFAIRQEASGPVLYSTTVNCSGVSTEQSHGVQGNTNEAATGFTVTNVIPASGALNNNCGNPPPIPPEL